MMRQRLTKRIAQRITTTATLLLIGSLGCKHAASPPAPSPAAPSASSTGTAGTASATSTVLAALALPLIPGSGTFDPGPLAKGVVVVNAWSPD
jgi:hypothetical protein